MNVTHYPILGPPTSVTVSVPVPQPTTGPTPGLAFNDPSTQIMLTSWLGALAKALSDWQGTGHLTPASLGLIGAAVALTISVLLAKHILSASLVKTITTDASYLTQFIGASSNPQPATPQTPAALLADGKAIHAALTYLLATQGPKT
jgi:uncharacterized membrane protein YeaQ/YmgE (transglycosylase-associated protein family)